jgi:hypothetical protein
MELAESRREIRQGKYYDVPSIREAAHWQRPVDSC